MRFFWLWLAALLPALGLAAPRYHVTKLGPIQVVGGIRNVTGMGNDGSIALSGNGQLPAYRYYDGKYETFASITGGYSPSALVRISSKDAFSFNDAGAVSFYNGQARQVYGTAELPFARVSNTTENGEFCYFNFDAGIFERKAVGYYKRNGAWQKIEHFGGKYATILTGINRHGDILGCAGGTMEITDRTFVIPRGTTTPVPLPFLGYAFAINDLGTVLGQGSYNMLVKDGNVIVPRLPDGVTPLEEDREMRLNNRDQIAGTGLRNGKREGFLWENGQSYWIRDVVDNPADLPALNWSPHIGFNDYGQISIAFTQNDVSNLYRLDPVPEPAPWLALGVGVALILRRRR